MKTEPALILGAVSAILQLLVAFGMRMTDQQMAAIVALATAVLTIVVTWWTRSNVYSQASVEKLERK